MNRRNRHLLSLALSVPLLVGSAYGQGYTVVAPGGSVTPPVTFSGPAGAFAQGMSSQQYQPYNPYAMQHPTNPGVPSSPGGTPGAPQTNKLQPTASDEFKPIQHKKSSKKPIVIAPKVLPPTELYGQAHALSGNTLEIQGHKLVLSGVVSPTRNQVCRLAGGIPWNCGAQARHSLETILKTGPARCEIESGDQAHCTILGQPINTAMNSR